ncbi:Hypp1814 [Branchiostoma lanceolatum]|uniref:Hypp1814 protein n=1 Tax=Branchiostoma lanceolatum TaxID=7740 RepID=A0A8J9ZKT8_BRALA|nr:Hypp1814 [Branchiostoma lanceolatum]
MILAKNTIPNKYTRVTGARKPWITPELLEAIIHKTNLYNTFKASPTSENWKCYTKTKNRLTKDLRQAEAEYYSTVSERLRSAKDAQVFWSVLKQATGKGKTSIPALSVDGTVVAKDKDKVELFNDIFVNVTREATHPDRTVRLPMFTNEDLSTIVLSVDEVQEVLRGLHPNKAPGPDGIPNRLLKEAAPVISTSLCNLFNLSLSSSQLPAEWKQCNVTPVYKKGDRTNPSNYRPIALLPTVPKVLERLVHNRLYTYLMNNNLININQSGFKKGDGTVPQLMRLVDEWAKSIDDPNISCTAAVFLDVRRAFDTVWHDGLIYKLSRYGIKGPLNKWFSDYLVDRQQRVVINGIASTWGYTRAGVPQGSILGPLLFLVFINDIKELPCSSNINCFADDTSLSNSGPTAQVVASTTNTDLQLVSTWFLDWGLQLHPDKCKVLCIKSPRSRVQLPSIYIAGQIVEEVPFYTHLGATIHQTLRWTEHVQTTSNKARRTLGFLWKLRDKLSREALEVAYNTMVRPKLEYAAVLFGDLPCSASKILERVQYQAGCLITGAPRRTPSSIVLQELEWDSLSSRRHFHSLILMYKLVKGLVPPHLQPLTPVTRGERTHVQLRNSGHLHLPRCRTQIYKSSFIPHASRLWNQLPQVVKEAPSLSTFKNLCKAHLLTQPRHQARRRNGPRLDNILAARRRMDQCL